MKPNCSILSKKKRSKARDARNHTQGSAASQPTTDDRRQSNGVRGLTCVSVWKTYPTRRRPRHINKLIQAPDTRAHTHSYIHTHIRIPNSLPHASKRTTQHVKPLDRAASALPPRVHGETHIALPVRKHQSARLQRPQQAVLPHGSSRRHFAPAADELLFGRRHRAHIPAPENASKTASYILNSFFCRSHCCILHRRYCRPRPLRGHRLPPACRPTRGRYRRSPSLRTPHGDRNLLYASLALASPSRPGG